MQTFSLFILASYQTLVLIIFQKNTYISSTTQQLHQKFSEVFFTELKILLQKQQITLQQIKEVYAGIGPGSFMTHRTIVTFLKTATILDATKTIFTINNLIFQAGLDSNVISLLKANKQKYYCYIRSKDITKPETTILKETDIPLLAEKYPDHKIYQDLMEINYWERFLMMQKQYTKITDWQTLKAIEN